LKVKLLVLLGKRLVEVAPDMVVSG